MTRHFSYLIRLAAALLFGAAAMRLRGEDAALEEVASFPKQQVTGVAVSTQGRVFVNFPFWVRRPYDLGRRSRGRKAEAISRRVRSTRAGCACKAS